MQAHFTKKVLAMSDDKKEQNSKAKGGIARANSLSKERRSEIAKKAAIARWGEKPPRATHKGNFKNEFGLDVECYVLGDENKTAVITQLGMGEILGLGSGGSRLPRFVFNKTMSEYLWPELREKLENPIVFYIPIAGQPNGSGVKANGYEAGVLIDICRAVTQAESDGKLTKSQVNVARQSSIIVNASAKAGIENLVYALSGYDRTKQEVIEAYKRYVADEAREYEREFTPELYEQWYRLYGLEKPVRGRPWAFKYLTIDHIYNPLARSEGKVFSLAKSLKNEKGDKQDKVHMFLSEVGVKALRTQIGKITGIAMVSNTREEYEKFIDEKVIGQKRIDFE